MIISIRVIEEKLTDLEKAILVTIENELQCLDEELEIYKLNNDEYESISNSKERINDLYFSILDDFVKHGKAVEEELK